MNAIDTNVVVRALLNDDAVQSPIARAILIDGAFISNTVLLETGWLLRSRFSLAPLDIATILESLLDMPSVNVENVEALRWAVRRSRKAGDLSDLIHVASAAGATRFLSFDRRLIRAARADAPVAVELVGN